MKPINFRQLNALMMGIWDENEKQTCVYKPGMWESGGWLQRIKVDMEFRGAFVETEIQRQAMLQLLSNTFSLLSILKYTIRMKFCFHVSAECLNSSPRMALQYVTPMSKNGSVDEHQAGSTSVECTSLI